MGLLNLSGHNEAFVAALRGALRDQRVPHRPCSSPGPASVRRLNFTLAAHVLEPARLLQERSNGRTDFLPASGQLPSRIFNIAITNGC